MTFKSKRKSKKYNKRNRCKVTRKKRARFTKKMKGGVPLTRRQKEKLINMGYTVNTNNKNVFTIRGVPSKLLINTRLARDVRKNERLEATVINQAVFIDSLQALISESDKALKDLDDKIWLESDKELQTVFHNLKAIQEALNQFNRR